MAGGGAQLLLRATANGLLGHEPSITGRIIRTVWLKAVKVSNTPLAHWHTVKCAISRAGCVCDSQPNRHAGGVEGGHPGCGWGMTMPSHTWTVVLLFYEHGEKNKDIIFAFVAVVVVVVVGRRRESTDPSVSLSHMRLAAAHHFSALCRPSRSDHKPVRDLCAAERLPVSERLKRLLRFLPYTCCATGLLSAFFTKWSLFSSLQGVGLSIVPLSSCMLVCRSGKARGCTPCICVECRSMRRRVDFDMLPLSPSLPPYLALILCNLQGRPPSSSDQWDPEKKKKKKRPRDAVSIVSLGLSLIVFRTAR